MSLNDEREQHYRDELRTAAAKQMYATSVDWMALVDTCRDLIRDAYREGWMDGREQAEQEGGR